MARKYGDLVFLTKGNINPFSTDRNTLGIAEKLQSLDEDDYFLLSGTPSLVFCTAIVACVKGLKQFNLLLWNTKTGDYELRRLHLDNIKELIKEVKIGIF